MYLTAVYVPRATYACDACRKHLLKIVSTLLRLHRKRGKPFDLVILLNLRWFSQSFSAPITHACVCDCSIVIDKWKIKQWRLADYSSTDYWPLVFEWSTTCILSLDTLQAASLESFLSLAVQLLCIICLYAYDQWPRTYPVLSLQCVRILVVLIRNLVSTLVHQTNAANAQSHTQMQWSRKPNYVSLCAMHIRMLTEMQWSPQSNTQKCNEDGSQPHTQIIKLSKPEEVNRTQKVFE